MANIKKDVAYKKAGSRDLLLDIYLPDEEEHTRAAVILLHGGGWRQGSKSMMAMFGPELAGHGFVAVAPEYRLLEDSPWPAQIEDVKSAIRWVKAKAGELNIHPSKVAVEGFSAGGQLALMAAGTPDDPEYARTENGRVSEAVAAVVAFFSPVEFCVGPPSPGVLSASILLGDHATGEDANKISPIHLISGSYPPAFLLHGTNDSMVPHVNSLRMFEALEKRNVPAELHLYPGHTHEFARLPSMMALTQAEIALFLRRMVVDPKKYHDENMELNMFADMGRTSDG